jgi:uncharacterized protein (DUF924 family)
MDPERILQFWFGEDLEDPERVAERCNLWFGNHPDFDEMIRQRFEHLPALAAEGRLGAWRSSPPFQPGADIDSGPVPP